MKKVYSHYLRTVDDNSMSALPDSIVRPVNSHSPTIWAPLS
ncbi:hypothetical protein [Muribaculum intestinale]